MPEKFTPSQPLSDINVTPFVDVMLVLLVIFMVTAPMFSQGLPVNLPEAAAPALVSDKPLVVSINQEKAVYLGDREVGLKNLKAALDRGYSGEVETLFVFDEDFLGESYEVDESGDPSDFPG